MATFRPNFDLLSIPGAKPMPINIGTADKPNVVNYICIPADINEITIEQSTNDPTRYTAYMNLMMRPFGQSYINSVVENRQRRGDSVDPSKVESHEITLNHSAEFIKAWTNIVSQAVLKEHPEWQGQNPYDKVEGDKAANELYYEVRRRINKRIGKAYPVISSSSQQKAPVNNFGAPVMAQPFTLPQSSQAPAASASMEAAPVEDLPF